MRRRIRSAIVGVSAIILLALGVPLAIAVHRSVLDSEVVELQATAARALAEIDLPLDADRLRRFAAEGDAPSEFSVYAPTGARIYGSGPKRADVTVRLALHGRPASTSDDELVVATPIVESGSERVHGALRVTESLHDAEHRARVAWLAMAIAAFLALGLAWLIGNRLARTLSAPLSDLAAGATATGDVGPLGAGPASGIPEIDSLAEALAVRARRANDALLRERRFSADVSHQLRTPITALRLKLESAQAHGTDSSDLDTAIADLDRVDATIEHLLALARDSIPAPADLRLDQAVVSAAHRWATAATAVHRSVVADAREATTVKANAASVDQVLDVLIDNALRHGAGTVQVAIRRIAGGVAVDVTDQGHSIAPLDAERVFQRGHKSGEGTGIGLSVARGIAEAEGARLVLSRHRPTTFSLLLLEDVAAPPGA